MVCCIEPDLFHWNVTLTESVQFNPLHIQLKQILECIIHQIDYRGIHHDQRFSLAIQLYAFEIITLTACLFKEVIDRRIAIVGIIVGAL